MVTASDIRQKIQHKIFTPYGKAVTLQSRTAPTLNNRGEVTTFNYNISTINIIPYDINQERLMYERFSEVNAGDMFAAVPYTVTVHTEDRLVIDVDTWEVKECIQHLLPTNLVTVVRLAKVIL